MQGNLEIEGNILVCEVKGSSISQNIFSYKSQCLGSFKISTVETLMI